KNPALLNDFAKLDDTEIAASVKAWMDCDDKILRELCSSLIERKLYKIELENKDFASAYKNKLIEKAIKKYGVTRKEASYFVYSSSVNNKAYMSSSTKINVLMKDGTLMDVADASDQLNLQMLSQTVTKYYLCYPKSLNQ
ncbi:MAG: phosphohydrolase, partial [Flavobacteriales bacterium]|nr:phosphohydrolase [Flavobacteriales bacterium]